MSRRLTIDDVVDAATRAAFVAQCEQDDARAATMEDAAALDAERDRHTLAMDPEVEATWWDAATLRSWRP